MLGASQNFSDFSNLRHSERGEESVFQTGTGGGQAAKLPQPDPDRLRRLLNSPEGRALLRILRADGGAGVRAASEALRGGDLEGAKAALEPLLAGTEAETLTGKLEEKL